MKTLLFFIWTLTVAAAGAAGWQFFNPIARELRSARAIGRNYTEARIKAYTTIAALRYSGASAGGTRPLRVELLRVLEQELGVMEEALSGMSDSLRVQAKDILTMRDRLCHSRDKWAVLGKMGIYKNTPFTELTHSRVKKLSVMENFATVTQRGVVEMRETIDRELIGIKESRNKINNYLVFVDKRATIIPHQKCQQAAGVMSVSLKKPATRKQSRGSSSVARFRSGKVNLRSAPNLLPENLIGAIQASGKEKIKLISKKGGWYFVRLAENKTAYVWGGNMADVVLLGIKKGGNSDWFYAEPGQRKYKYLTPGEQYVLHARIGAFYKVYDPRYGAGYINKRYAQKI